MLVQMQAFLAPNGVVWAGSGCILVAIWAHYRFETLISQC